MRESRFELRNARRIPAADMGLVPKVQEADFPWENSYLTVTVSCENAITNLNECFTGGGVRLTVPKEGIYPLLYCQHSLIGFSG